MTQPLNDRLLNGFNPSFTTRLVVNLRELHINPATTQNLASLIDFKLPTTTTEPQRVFQSEEALQKLEKLPETVRDKVAGWTC